MPSSEHKDLAVYTTDGVRFGKELREKEFLFARGWGNLNHGSFGTYPLPVREVMRGFQDELESRPDKFIRYTYPVRLDEARAAVAKVVNAPTSTIVFVPNATTGLNTVLRNISFDDGDHILYFSTIYGAIEKTIFYFTETTPAASVKVSYTYPVEDDWLVTEFWRKVKEVEKKGGKVKVAIFDTVVSMPGVRMPFERLTEACKEAGVLSCVDAAHGVGHVDLNLSKLDPDFLTSNCHKWLYVPRGCAILYVPERNHHLIRTTLPTSHGFVPMPLPGTTAPGSPFPASTKSPFVLNFEFVGTIDNAPYLCVPAALEFRERLGGEEVIREYNTKLAQRGGALVARLLGTEVLDNSTKTLSDCCMTTILLPIHASTARGAAEKAGIDPAGVGAAVRDWINRVLVDEFDTFVQLVFYGGQWWARLSGQVYLEMADFERGAEVLRGICERVERGEWVRGVKSRL